MFNARRLLPAIALSAALAAGALILMPTSSEGSTQDHNRLEANVVATNPGPLTACFDTCTPGNFVAHLIYVKNKNELTNTPVTTRATLPNAFVVSSVDEKIFVDGVQTFTVETQTPPPNAVFRGQSGHWPSTVTCPPDATQPCNVVGNPAVLPGENTAAFYIGWFHGPDEPNGTYVFRFTVHGTLNGTPVDLTASGPPIVMTD